MDYRMKIIELLVKITDERVLRFLYLIVKAMADNQEK
jgi:hypothetical protein